MKRKFSCVRREKLRLPLENLMHYVIINKVNIPLTLSREAGKESVRKKVQGKLYLYFVKSPCIRRFFLIFYRKAVYENKRNC